MRPPACLVASLFASTAARRVSFATDDAAHPDAVVDHQLRLNRLVRAHGRGIGEPVSDATLAMALDEGMRNRPMTALGRRQAAAPSVTIMPGAAGGSSSVAFDLAQVEAQPIGVSRASLSALTAQPTS